MESCIHRRVHYQGRSKSTGTGSENEKKQEVPGISHIIKEGLVHLIARSGSSREDDWPERITQVKKSTRGLP